MAIRFFSKMKSQMLAVMIASSLYSIPEAYSHPHEFVDMRVETVFNSKGQATGFRYAWGFDEFFSAYALEGKDANKNGTFEQTELDALMNEILGNIHEIDYFTKFDENGVLPEIARAIPVSAKFKDRRFFLSFDVPFKMPVSVAAKPLRYAIYDDEFYIAMEHEAGDDSSSLRGAPKNCKTDILAPNPDEAIASFAGSLDKNESGGRDLGVHFAEWVTISCN